jgi:hypothetical protein
MTGPEAGFPPGGSAGLLARLAAAGSVLPSATCAPAGCGPDRQPSGHRVDARIAIRCSPASVRSDRDPWRLGKFRSIAPRHRRCARQPDVGQLPAVIAQRRVHLDAFLFRRRVCKDAELADNAVASVIAFGSREPQTAAARRRSLEDRHELLADVPSPSSKVRHRGRQPSSVISFAYRSPCSTCGIR